MDASRVLARAYEQQLRFAAAQVDLRNRGRYRSTYLLDEFFHDLVDIASPGLFVEAGAFDAVASRRFASQHPGARAVAFEANPDNFARWTSEVDFAAAGVEYVNLALTDEVGPVTFNLRSTEAADPAAAFEDNSILRRGGEADRTDPDVVSVEGTTLDTYFADSDARAAMWIDVEGATGLVVDGGPQLLARCDVVKVEVEDIALWDGQWLAVRVIEAMLGFGLVPLARDNQFEGQYNVVFVSERLADDGRTVAALEQLLRDLARPELPGPLGAVRRNEGVRRAARAVLRKS